MHNSSACVAQRNQVLPLNVGWGCTTLRPASHNETRFFHSTSVGGAQLFVLRCATKPGLSTQRRLGVHNSSSCAAQRNQVLPLNVGWGCTTLPLALHNETRFFHSTSVGGAQLFRLRRTTKPGSSTQRRLGVHNSSSCAAQRNQVLPLNVGWGAQLFRLRRTTKPGWPIQAVLWLEWGTSQPAAIPSLSSCLVFSRERLSLTAMRGRGSSC